ncbi:MAG TPA: hypothetical protein VID93_09725, partial [Acidimicrobiales bacterium]
MNPTSASDRATASRADESRWRQAAGLQLLGQVQGSGMRDPAYLVRRADDQVVQLSELLHLVVVHADPARPAADVAAAVSERYGRTLTTEGLAHLVTTRLEPLGLVLPAETEEPTRPVRARPLLALTLKATLLPPHRAQVVARMLRPMFWPPVVVVALLALVVADVALVVGGDFWLAVTEVLATPTTALLIYGLLVASAVVHEVGHAVACRYGGAEPGEIGVGIYIVFPAFYTDVTDSYRLGRAGRVRTDLGGLYFNALTVLVLAAAYTTTGSGLLLLTAFALQLQMLQQLIPVVRFDGYYVVSDVAGVPDLFARVGPVLRSLRPGHPVDPRVTELRPYARRFVAGWVLVVVPLLTAVLAWTLWNLPEFIARARGGIQLQQLVFDVAWQRRDWPAMALAVISIALLLVPLVGIAVVLWRLATSVTTFLRSRMAAHARVWEERMGLEAEGRGPAAADPPPV